MVDAFVYVESLLSVYVAGQKAEFTENLHTLNAANMAGPGGISVTLGYGGKGHVLPYARRSPNIGGYAVGPEISAVMS